MPDEYRAVSRPNIDFARKNVERIPPRARKAGQNRPENSFSPKTDWAAAVSQ